MFMRRRTYHISLLVLTAVFLTLNIKAQRLPLTSTHIAKSLINAGIDTVLIYNPCNSLSMIRPTDSSLIEEISYLITKKGYQLSIERLTSEYQEGRGQFMTHKFILKNDSLGIFDYLHDNFNSIVSDTLLPAVLKETIDGKDTLIRLWGSHPCYAELIILTASGTYRNGILDLYLADGTVRNADGSIRARRESINYEYNTSTSIFKIISMLEIEEEEIKKIYRF
jgi:hypothetical protein